MVTTARPAATASTALPAWVLVGVAVLVQIVYPLVPSAWLTGVTVTSVVVFFLASLADVVRVHGVRGGLLLVGIAGGGGLVAEAVGLATGFPFGSYAYTGTLGPELLGVPVVVPLAWAMMAWPALVVGRTLAGRGPGVVAVGAFALAAWDLFLDPQMVSAGHWTWFAPDPALPLVPGIPLTNYAGWLLVSVLVVGGLHRALGPGRGSGPATALYLWVYASSVLAHLAFFGLPGSAVVGGIGMGVVAVPFAVATWRRLRGSLHGTLRGT
ncbi:carotenoid biosynthesis protein [Actinomycetospora soli]|uniref:carotenoid biosynthesis protein n=1 Tax=Actinomycetospora soli TaxID=2893887 RepID=UPI001E61E7D1|nr:carotenoid biosynthesis protein [Actinomycetospora soli]MCD2188594.1 carotenoid biosynthesis protein [Actinomycetospora soli]